MSYPLSEWEILASMDAVEKDVLAEMLQQVALVHRKVYYFDGPTRVTECEFCAERVIYDEPTEASGQWRPRGVWPCETMAAVTTLH